MNERRSGYGYSRENNLYTAATQSTQRKTIPVIDKDSHQVVSNLGRRMLMRLGRFLFSNMPAVAGIVQEQAILASENYQPQFYGANKAWNDLAEEYLLNWHKIMCFEGEPYDFNSFVRLAIIAIVRDGDFGYLLTNNVAGIPQVQTIPAHRIHSLEGVSNVETGTYKGRALVDGVILDDYRRVVAYRVYDDVKLEYIDVPRRNFGLPFIPMWQDQVRGFSMLSSGAFDWLDLSESRSFELIAQKAAAAIALIEENEAGGLDPTTAAIRTSATFSTGDGHEHELSTPTEEKMSGGEVRYFRSNTGGRLSTMHYDRPGANAQNYQNDILRDACTSLGWSFFYAIDPSKPGGASIRIIIDKLNRTLDFVRMHVAKVLRRIDGWAIATAILEGRLPMDEDWYKLDYQFPAKLTADRKYDSDVDIQELNAKVTTLKTVCARRGEYWEDVQDQWLLEKKRLQDRAKELGVELEAVPQDKTQDNRPERKPMGKADDDEESGDKSDKNEDKDE